MNQNRVENLNATKRARPYLAVVWGVMLIPALVIPDFTIGCMMCLHSLSFSVIEVKEYFIVWGIVEFRALPASLC